MKILIVSQYFWPENFKINDIALGLVDRGHSITVLTGKPNYPGGEFYPDYGYFSKNEEVWNSIKIIRSKVIPRRNARNIQLAINYLSFAFFATIRSFFIKGKFDLIFVFEPSPITVGIPAAVLSRRLGIPIYFWVQDLWPESVVAAGNLNNKLVLKILNSLTKWIYDQCEQVLVQSKAFMPFLINQGVSSEKIVFYPNSTESFYQPVNIDSGTLKLFPKDRFIFLFAGNIGESQDFDSIVLAAKILANDEIKAHFIVLGDGRKKSEVLLKIQELGLQDYFSFLGSFPSQDMPRFFSAADCLLVTLKPDPIFSLTIPSKLQSYLACGKPIIAYLNGEGAKLIKESGAGFFCDSGDIKQFSMKMDQMIKLSDEERATLGANGRHYFLKNFDRELLLDRLVNIFDGKL